MLSTSDNRRIYKGYIYRSLGILQRAEKSWFSIYTFCCQCWRSFNYLKQSLPCTASRSNLLLMQLKIFIAYKLLSFVYYPDVLFVFAVIIFRQNFLNTLDHCNCSNMHGLHTERQINYFTPSFTYPHGVIILSLNYKCIQIFMLH